MQRAVYTQTCLITVQHAQTTDPLPDLLDGIFGRRGQLGDPVLNGTGADRNIKYTCQKLMNPVYAHHSNGRQCGGKGFQVVSILLGSGDIFRKFANEYLAFCHWAAAYHLAMLNQSGFHNNVRFIPPLGNTAMAIFPVWASAARLGVMLPNFVRRFHEFHGAALVAILSAGLRTAGFAPALGCGFRIAIAGRRSGTVSAVLHVFPFLLLLKQRINLFRQRLYLLRLGLKKSVLALNNP